VSTPREEEFAFINPCAIAFKIERSDNYRIVISRPQPFQQTQGDRIPESVVIEAFVATLYGMRELLNSSYRDDVLLSLQRRVIARALPSNGNEVQVLAAIDALIAWSARLYEGAPITASIGLRVRLKIRGGRFGVADCRPWRRGSWPVRRRCGLRSLAPNDASGSSIQRCVRRPICVAGPRSLSAGLIGG